MCIKFRFVLVFIVVLLCTELIKAQGPYSRWYFSNGAGLTISSTTAVVATGGQITYTAAGCASIADANGNLLFYTDGMTVWNQFHNAMPNGTGLLGNNSIQSAVILKKPNSANLFYVFTCEVGGATPGLRYSIVDMSLVSGTGSVTVKNVNLYNFAVGSNLAATKHCNGTDYWIVGSGATGVVSFSLTQNGVSTVNLSNGSVGGATCIKISPNGKRIASVQTNTYNFAPYTKHFLSISEFDNGTGLATGSGTYVAYVPNQSGWPFPVSKLYGCEFSPNGRYLYSVFTNALQQFDLCGALGVTFPTPLIAINTGTAETSAIGGLQLAPNGKIYVVRTNQSFLGVINNPDLPGNACNYNSLGASIGTATCALTLPNLVTSDFEVRSKLITYTSTINACQTLTFSPPYPCSITGYSATSYAWNFGDPSSAANTSSLGFPVHVFSNVGTYTVSLIVNYDCNKADTIAQTVNVVSPALSVLGPTIGCTAVSTTVAVLGGSGNYTFSWTPGNYTTAAVSNLASGLYTVSFYDAANYCRGNSTLSLQAISFSASALAQPPLCTGQSNASCTLSVLGGSGLYSYTWQPTNANTPVLSGIPAGTYVAVFSDNTYFCTGSRTVTIPNPAPVVLNMAAPSTDVCVGATASVYCQATGGTAPYFYNWINGGSATTQTFSENQTGTYVYSVVTLDANNCAASNTISLNYLNNPTITVISFSACSGSGYTLSAAGAAAYTWQPGNIYSNQISGIALVPNTYTITGKTLVCSDTKTASLVVYPLPNNNIIAPVSSCEQNTIQVTCQAAAGYTWSGPNGFGSSTQSFVIVCTPTSTGVYTLQVSNSNACVKSFTKTFTTNLLPQILPNGPGAFCTGEQFTLTASGADSYIWQPVGIASATCVPLPNGSQTYTVLGTNTITGCQNSATISVQELKCTGIAEFGKSTLQIIPNPANNYITIVSLLEHELEFIDIYGKVILEKKVNSGSTTIDVQKLQVGIYFLRDKKTQGINPHKIIIAR